MRTLLSRAAGWAIILDVALLAFYGGLRYRQWTWRQSYTTRFWWDSNNEYRNGVEAARDGFFTRFDRVAAAKVKRQGDTLDYVPLRLAVFMGWARLTQEKYPDAFASAAWRPQYDFDWRLTFHTMLEVMASIGAFLLVRHWVRRSSRPPPPPPPSVIALRLRRAWYWLHADIPMARAVPMTPVQQRLPHFRGAGLGMLAALLLWFNPAVVQNSHAWVQCDTWVAPFFLWAAYLASARWWFTAGLVVAVGAMLKGQLVFAAGIFLFWPLLAGAPWLSIVCILGLAAAMSARIWLSGSAAGSLSAMLATLSSLAAIAFAAGLLVIIVLGARWGAVARWVCGLAFGAALIVAPWMLRDGPRALNALEKDHTILTFRQSLHWPAVWWVGSVTAGALILLLVLKLWPAWRWLRWRRIGWIMAGAVAAALLLCIPIFDASTSWFKQGFMVPTEKFPGLVIGPSDNLPALLQHRFGWRNRESTAFTIDSTAFWIWPHQAIHVSIRTMLGLVYALTLLLCSIAAAIQERRNDRGFLLAITAPWILVFALMVQMHERYLLFAAAIGCVCVAVSAGTTLLVLLLGAASWIMTFAQMLNQGGGSWQRDVQGGTIVSPAVGRAFQHISAGTFPDLAWVVLLSAAIFLYLSFAPSRMGRRRNHGSSVERPRTPATSGRADSRDGAPAAADPRLTHPTGWQAEAAN